MSLSHCDIKAACRARVRTAPQHGDLKRRWGTSCVVLWTLAGWLHSSAASAHHSFASFDMTKTITLHGTVKELQWTNPHCFVQLVVPRPSGSVEWSLEMNSPLGIYRSGWRPHTVNPGDKVTVVINPSKDGTPSGRLVSATDAEGHILGNPAAGPPQGPKPPKGRSP